MGSENSSDGQSRGRRSLRVLVPALLAVSALVVGYAFTERDKDTGDPLSTPTAAPGTTASEAPAHADAPLRRRAELWIGSLSDRLVTRFAARPPDDPWTLWLRLRALGPKATDAQKQAFLQVTPAGLSDAAPPWLRAASVEALALTRMEARLSGPHELTGGPIHPAETVAVNDSAGTVALAWNLEVQALAVLRSQVSPGPHAKSRGQDPGSHRKLGHALVHAEQLLNRSLRDPASVDQASEALPVLLLAQAMFRTSPLVFDPLLTPQIQRDFARLQTLRHFGGGEAASELAALALFTEACASYALSQQPEGAPRSSSLATASAESLGRLLDRLEQLQSIAPEGPQDSKDWDFALVSGLRALRIASSAL